MVGESLLNLVRNNNALKFDHTKYSNPFAYYTLAIHRSFLQYMNYEKKHRNIRDALLIEAGENPSFAYSEAHHSSDLDKEFAQEINELKVEIENIKSKQTSAKKSLAADELSNKINDVLKF